jgi:hypothetical protein
VTTRVAAFAAVFVALYAAHMVADHWVQTQWESDTKSRPGWVGRRACALHVCTYTLTAVLALWVMVWRTGLYLDPVRPWIGLGVSAWSHYLIDRRTILAWATRMLRKDPAWVAGWGRYQLDQSAHVGFLFLAALIMC